MLDQARYFLALLMLVTLPAAYVYWLVIHPWASFWRRQGPRITFSVATAAMVLAGWAAYSVRGVLLRIEYGFQPLTSMLAAALYLLSMLIAILCRRHLKFKTLVGLPEVGSPDKYPSRLLSEGIYGRVRHPRYLGILIGLLAFALFTNYLAVWGLLALSLPVFYLVIVLEERELRQRFGEEYDRYCERVPRLLPRPR